MHIAQTNAMRMTKRSGSQSGAMMSIGHVVAESKMDAKGKKEVEKILVAKFNALNEQKFQGVIESYSLKFSPYSARTHGRINFQKKEIMISFPMLEQYGWDAVEQTLLHEMCHARVHQQGGQPRHTKRFWREFEKRGGKRDKMQVKPKAAYVYACPTCDGEFERMRRIAKPWLYSCSTCDKRFNLNHRLYLKRDKYQNSLEHF